MVEMRKSIRDMDKYVPSKTIEEVAKQYGFLPEEVIKLGSNENPLGPSPKAVQAVKDYADAISSYPSVDAAELRTALAQYIGCPVDRIVTGNGADGVLDVLTRIFVEKGDETIISMPTFSYYELFTRLCDGVPKFVPRDSNFDVDIDALIKSISSKTKIVFLCSPNNPTGNQICEEDLRKVLNAADAMVVVDEAYAEFADSSAIGLVGEHKNLVVMRTMSKAFGLAGLRVGYGVVPSWIFKEYMKVLPAFSVNKLGIVAAIAALDDREHLRRTIRTVKNGRTFLIENIPFKTYPSQANFVLVDVSPLSAEEVCEALLRRGIIVRDWKSFRGAGDSLVRISVGTMEQNKRVVEELSSVKKEVQD